MANGPSVIDLVPHHSHQSIDKTTAVSQIHVHWLFILLTKFMYLSHEGHVGDREEVNHTDKSKI